MGYRHQEAATFPAELYPLPMVIPGAFPSYPLEANICSEVFWDLWLQSLQAWKAAEAREPGRAGQSFPKLPYSLGPAHARFIWSVAHVRSSEYALSLNLLWKKKKKLPYIKRSSVKVWWALHWKRKSLRTHFGWDADLLGAPAVSHETSLGPNFIISKNGNYHTTYLLGSAAQEAADGSFEIQFVAGRGGSYL